MTTTQELIELVKELLGGKVTCLEKRAADTIESLSAEVERLTKKDTSAITEDALFDAAVSWCDSNGIDALEPEQLGSLVRSLFVEARDIKSEVDQTYIEGLERRSHEMKSKIEALDYELRTSRAQLEAQTSEIEQWKVDFNEMKLERDTARAELEAQGEAVPFGYVLKTAAGFSRVFYPESHQPTDINNWDAVYTHPAPAAPVVEHAGLPDAVEFFLDVYDESDKPEEHRIYIPEAYGNAIAGMRTALAALHPTQPKGEKA